MSDKISVSLSPQHWELVGAFLREGQYKLVQPVIKEIADQIDAHNAVQEKKE